MSTLQEKLQAIDHAVNVARRRQKTLETMKEFGALDKAREYELDMTIDCIQRGKKILKENGYKPKDSK
jgi:hypothetical protein